MDKNYRNATASDISAIAKIHIAAFDGFFLSQLGYKFLCIMYLAFLKSPSSIFVVHDAGGGQVTGFAVGTLQGQKDRWLALRFFPQFVVATLPAILHQPVGVVKKLWRRFFDASELPQVPMNSVMLRSIAVCPSMRRAGIASRLLQSLEILTLKKGLDHVYLITDQELNERAQLFYSRCGYIMVSQFKQDGHRQMRLMSKNLNRFTHE
jgi:GNAT superfamily N-acetyltransferase